jgi:hypothetical protein
LRLKTSFGRVCPISDHHAIATSVYENELTSSFRTRRHCLDSLPNERADRRHPENMAGVHGAIQRQASRAELELLILFTDETRGVPSLGG